MFGSFFHENRAVYEIMWGNIVKADRPQMRTLYDACALRAGYLRLQERKVCNFIAFPQQKCLRERYGCLYLLTPRSRVLLEKLTGLQLVKKFPAFCGTRRFIAVFTSDRHLFLSWARRSSPYLHIRLPEVPSLYYPPIYAWVSQVVSIPQVSPQKPCMHVFSPILATCPVHLILI